VQELVKLVVDKTGVPEAAAQIAVQTVLQANGLGGLFNK
jgi:predicted homoserine dehydrogenase-like protein